MQVNTQQVGRAPQRPLVWRQDADPQQLGELDVTILQYNILGRCYAMPQWFPGCPPDALDWEKRKSRLVAEIQAYKPDIVCLQELDDYDFFKKNLRLAGYDSSFKRRPGGKQDGCGIFYRMDRLDQVCVKSIEFADSTNRVAILSGFSLKVPNTQKQPGSDSPDSLHASPFVVASTHLYWDGKESGIQKAQLRQIAQELQSFVPDVLSFYLKHIPNRMSAIKTKIIDTHKLFTLAPPAPDHSAPSSQSSSARPSTVTGSSARESTANSTDADVILAGDFNALVDSDTYRYMQSLGFKSCHREVRGREPDTTKAYAKRTVDYIWYSVYDGPRGECRGLEAVAVAEMGDINLSRQSTFNLTPTPNTTTTTAAATGAATTNTAISAPPIVCSPSSSSLTACAESTAAKSAPSSAPASAAASPVISPRSNSFLNAISSAAASVFAGLSGRNSVNSRSSVNSSASREGDKEKEKDGPRAPDERYPSDHLPLFAVLRLHRPQGRAEKGGEREDPEAGAESKADTQSGLMLDVWPWH